MEIIKLNLHKPLIYSIIGSFIFLFSACGSYRNVTAPTVEGISAFKVGKVHDGQLPFTFTTRLKNPDKLGFKVKRVDLELMFAGTRIAEIKSNHTMRIKRQLEPELNWEVSAELAPLLKKPGALIGTLLRGKINFEVSGTITVKKFLWSKTIPVKLRLPVEIPAP
jgi:LEA14-like dessication related protein